MANKKIELKLVSFKSVRSKIVAKIKAPTADAALSYFKGRFEKMGMYAGRSGYTFTVKER